MEKKSNASSPVILLLSVFFIFTESIRIFTGEKEPYYTEDMQLIWLTGAWFLVIAALLLACFILCIRGKRLWWHRLLRIPLTMYFLYCGAVAVLLLSGGYGLLFLLPALIGGIVIAVAVINEKSV